MKTCFVLRKEQDGNKVLVYIGKMNSGIRKRAQAHANKDQVPRRSLFRRTRSRSIQARITQ